MVSYAVGYVGQALMWVCLVLSAASAATLFMGHAGAVKNGARSADGTVAVSGSARKLTAVGYALVAAVAVCLFVCCAIIVGSFFTHNIAIEYVAHNYPAQTDSLYWLYLLAGLWSSRSGSLLTWGFLIAAFAAWVAWHRRGSYDVLSNVALGVTMCVVTFFVAIMVFSSTNNPFTLTDPSYIVDGKLTGMAALWGMNALLEHWAMAIHPPTLFIGYAGMTIPFAYAISTLVCNDPSPRWVDLCNRITLFAFVFLTAGIGLGAVWAYVVLGWGGYWGWDPVENASLLSWLTSVALIHSFTAFRRRRQMLGWSLFTATITFCFVILGTFITRSGLVESVHAFSADEVSTYLFLALMIASLASLAILYAMRRRAFLTVDDIESVVSKNGSYYLTNIIMVFSGILLAYLTVSSALPTWLPAGGLSIGKGAYESIARPLGILLCALAAVCPFLGWKRTDGPEFVKNVRVPLIVAAIVFVLLCVIYVTRLLPLYSSTIELGGYAAAELESMGPAWYVNGLAVVGLLVSALLFANSAYLIVRGVRTRMRNKSESWALALGRLFSKSPAQAGGFLTHMGLGIVLAGLIGSSMYVAERTLAFTGGEDPVQIGSYTLTYEGGNEWYDDDKNACASQTFLVSSNGSQIGRISPSLQMDYTPYGYEYGQTRYSASVISSPLEDLFVVFQGWEANGAASVNIRVNPLISFVWVGFGVMVLGIVCAVWPKRGSAALKGALEQDAAKKNEGGK